MLVKIKKLRENAKLPEYAPSRGMRVWTCFLAQEILINPGESALVATGIAIELPRGTEAQVRPRSGLALKHQITVLNTPWYY